MAKTAAKKKTKSRQNAQLRGKAADASQAAKIPTGGEKVVQCLEREGVEIIFGLPGGAAIPLFDALIGSKIKLVRVRHEQGATHMADGYARATGKPGVVLVTSQRRREHRQGNERLKPESAPSWLDAFAPLARLAAPAREALAPLLVLAVPRGKILFSPAPPARASCSCSKAAPRVSVTAENGRRLLLYRIAPGETCVQTTLCLMGGLDYSAEGAAEADLRLVIVPPALFERLLRESPTLHASCSSALARGSRK